MGLKLILEVLSRIRDGGVVRVILIVLVWKLILELWLYPRIMLRLAKGMVLERRIEAILGLCGIDDILLVLWLQPVGVRRGVYRWRVFAGLENPIIPGKLILRLQSIVGERKPIVQVIWESCAGVVGGRRPRGMRMGRIHVGPDLVT